MSAAPMAIKGGGSEDLRFRGAEVQMLRSSGLQTL
jgi:hypothetical protein